VRSRIAKSAPGAAVFGERTMRGVIADSTAATRFQSFSLALFAGVALLLAVAGVYGLVAYLVAMRTREIGVRMALGAARQSILRMILIEGARLSALGVLLGLAGAWIVSKSLASMLYGISPLDGATYLTSSLVLFLAAIVACLGPALRASRVDPATALRSE